MTTEYQKGFDHGTDYMVEYMTHEGMVKIVDGVLAFDATMSLADFKLYLLRFSQEKKNLQNNLQKKSTDSV